MTERQSSREYWGSRGYPQTSHESGDCDCAARNAALPLPGLIVRHMSSILILILGVLWLNPAFALPIKSPAETGFALSTVRIFVTHNSHQMGWFPAVVPHKSADLQSGGVVNRKNLFIAADSQQKGDDRKRVRPLFPSGFWLALIVAAGFGWWLGGVIYK